MPSGDGAPPDEAAADVSDRGDSGDASDRERSGAVASSGSAPDDAPSETTPADASAADDVDTEAVPGSSGDGGSATRGASGRESSRSATRGPPDDRRGRREVEVPQSLYRIVTVFSTLLSILLVVVGISVLTMATTVLENPPASLVVQVLSLGVPTGALVEHRTTLSLGVGLVGLVLVAAGAGVYVYGSRFRAPGMGKSKDVSAEDSNDG